jgi:hypothetical protein
MLINIQRKESEDVNREDAGGGEMKEDKRGGE